MVRWETESLGGKKKTTCGITKLSAKWNPELILHGNNFPNYPKKRKCVTKIQGKEQGESSVDLFEYISISREAKKKKKKKITRQGCLL